MSKLDEIDGREIRCVKCNATLGKILEGSILKKDVKHICEKCLEKLNTLENAFKMSQEEMPGFLDGLFGKFK